LIMIVLEKKIDKVWDYDYYIAQATKTHINVTGKTKLQALNNLKQAIRKRIKRGDIYSLVEYLLK